MAEAGVDLFEIMDRLGHKDDETTTQVYLHITKEKSDAIISHDCIAFFFG